MVRRGGTNYFFRNMEFIDLKDREGRIWSQTKQCDKNLSVIRIYCSGPDLSSRIKWVVARENGLDYEGEQIHFAYDQYE